MEKLYFDEKLYMRIWDSLQPVYNKDPYKWCDCGNPNDHDGECKLEDILYDITLHIYIGFGGKINTNYPGITWHGDVLELFQKQEET